MILLLAFACSSETAAPPAPPVAPPPVEVAPPAPVAASAPTGTPWAIDSTTSTATASAHKVIGGHDLIFSGATGTVSVHNGVLVGLDVTVPIATLTTDAPKLTAHLVTPDFFDAAAMPNATFKATSVTGAAPTYTVVGDITIHGVTKSLTFPATVNVNEGVMTATAEVVLDRKDFGLVYPGKPDNLIQDTVELKVSLQAKAP